VVKRISDLAYVVEYDRQRTPTGRVSKVQQTIHISKLKPCTMRRAASDSPQLEETKEDVEALTTVPLPQPCAPHEQRTPPEARRAKEHFLEELGLKAPEAAPTAASSSSSSSSPSSIGASIHQRRSQQIRPDYSEAHSSKYPVHSQQQRYSLPARK
jgi:hypothetical protein